VDELIKTVSEKAGINAEQAKSAVASVMEFIKTKMPGIGEQITAALAGGGGGGVVDAVRKKIGI
jgi:nucleoid DNA-binding protein